MPEPFFLPGGKKQPDADRKIDTDKRYDVYCGEHGNPIVHRNVQFKGTRYLFQEGRGIGSYGSEFIELEQADGKSIFIAAFRILYFCEHEAIPPQSA